MDRKILEIAASVMKVSVDDERMCYKKIPEINGYYFWLSCKRRYVSNNRFKL